MKRILSVLLILFVVLSCDEKKKTSHGKKKEIPILTYQELAPFLDKNDEKIYVVNFWATWCAPCVKELPAFEKLHTNYQEENVEVVLVSLDFKEQVATKLSAFLLKNNIQSKVLVLNDPDQDTWIPKISTNWSGAIPATLIYSKNKRLFYERSFTYTSLEEEVFKFLK